MTVQGPYNVRLHSSNVKEPKIGVLVLGFNDRKYLSRVLGDLGRQSYTNYSVTFIDNASDDGSYGYVREEFPGIRAVRNSVNLGFSLAFNRQMQYSFQWDRCDAVIVMNSDMAVDDRDLIDKMVSTAFSSSDIALVQPRIYIENEEKRPVINTLGNEINFLGFSYVSRINELDVKPEGPDTDIAGASGACMLIKKEFFLKAGGFDSHFFAYMEDADLSWRAHLYGWRVVLCSSAWIWHAYEFTRTDTRPWKMRALERNRYLTMLKNYSAGTLAALLPALVLMDIGVLIFSIRRRWFWGKICSYADVLRLWPTMRAKRRDIQRCRVRNDSFMLRLFSGRMNAALVQNKLLNRANVLFDTYYEWLRNRKK